MKFNNDQIEKYLEKIKINEQVAFENSFCLEWQGSLNKDGYGLFFTDSKSYLVHRISWSINNGEINNGLCVLHHCDNRKCVNVKHLFLGTRKDNIKDMDDKNRRNFPYGDLHGSRTHPESRPRGDKNIMNYDITKRPSGERNGNAKLNEEDILSILSLYNSGDYTQKRISEIFKVSDAHINRIIKNKSWKIISRK